MPEFWSEGDQVVVGIGVDILNDREHIPSLIARCQGLFDYIEVFDGGNPSLCRSARMTLLQATPVLYHNPVLNLCGEFVADQQHVEAASTSAKILRASWAVEEMGYSKIAGHSIPYFMPAVLTDAVARKAAENLKTLNERFSVPILPETPAFEVVFGDVLLERFVQVIVDETDSDFVLDLTHVLSYSVATGHDMEECCRRMPLNRVREVHVAGGALVNCDGNEVFRDTHGSQRVPAGVVETLQELLPLLTRLRAITIEVDGGEGPYAVEDLLHVRRCIGL